MRKNRQKFSFRFFFWLSLMMNEGTWNVFFFCCWFFSHIIWTYEVELDPQLTSRRKRQRKLYFNEWNFCSTEVKGTLPLTWCSPPPATANVSTLSFTFSIARVCRSRSNSFRLKITSRSHKKQQQSSKSRYSECDWVRRRQRSSKEEEKNNIRVDWRSMNSLCRAKTHSIQAEILV